MATSWCPDLSIDPASVFVDEAHEKFMQLGTQTYNLAVQNLDGLNAVLLEPLEFSVSFDYPNAQPVVHRPERPTFDLSSMDFRDPGVAIPAAPEFQANPLVVSAAPELEAQAPVLTYGPRPTAPNISAPQAPPTPAELEMPVAPDYVLPVVPTLIELNLPDAPDLQLPLFEGERPEFIEPPFNETWDFMPSAYTERLVPQLIETINPMLQGRSVLPVDIERALFERGTNRISIETERAVEAAFDDTANRGFTQPQGRTLQQAKEIRQRGVSAAAEASRDIVIRQIELAIENVRAAITAGAALEGTLIQVHLEEQRFALQAAQFQRESAIAVFNLRVTVFNTRLQAYQTDAAVLRDRIQAELAKVELFRAQIEGERARGELNQQRAALYESQIRGVLAMAQFYREQVEAVKAQADVQRLGIERFRAQVDAYGERWRAHTAEWQGYIASVEGEGKRADVYRTLVEANAKRVDAWAASNNMQIEAERLRLAQHGMNLDVWGKGVERLRALLSAEETRLNAAGRAVDAQARIYTADANVEQALAAAADRSFQLGLERERARVETYLQHANMNIRQVEFLVSQFNEIQRAKATISSQLAASTMSAVNYGASVSSGRSKSIGCSTNFSFVGEPADA